MIGMVNKQSNGMNDKRKLYSIEPESPSYEIASYENEEIVTPKPITKVAQKSASHSTTVTVTTVTAWTKVFKLNRVE